MMLMLIGFVIFYILYTIKELKILQEKTELLQKKLESLIENNSQKLKKGSADSRRNKGESEHGSD